MQSISPQEHPAPRWLAGALIGLCAAQPLLDVLSFWTQTLGRATSVSLALRMLCWPPPLCSRSCSRSANAPT